MPKKPSTHPRMISSPVEIERMHEAIQAVFKGAAFYNNGTITFTYQKPMVLRQIKIGGRPLLLDASLGVAADERIELEFEPMEP